MMISVVLADDHRLVRAGLQSLLAAAPDLVVVGAASDGSEAVELVESLEPDVVLMDLGMPGMDGFEATRRIVADHPGTQVVVLTCSLDSEHVVEAVESGAVGYIAKDAEPRELLDGIRAVAAGRSPLDARAARVVLRARRAAPTSPGADLTDREREVLTLVGRGMANKQIARLLDISEGTVKVHIGHIFQRIGVTSRTAAAVWARHHLPADSPEGGEA